MYLSKCEVGQRIAVTCGVFKGDGGSIVSIHVQAERVFVHLDRTDCIQAFTADVLRWESVD